MLSKYYLLIRCFVSFTKFATPRVRRVCSINQIEYNLMYSIKCIQKVYPIRFIVITVLFLLLLFSYGFRVSEGKVSALNPVGRNGFEDLNECLWFSFVTVYNIGYGEYVPVTGVARCLAGLLAASGVAFSSMLVVSVIDYISMNNQELKSLSLMHRMDSRKQMENCAAEVVSRIVKISETAKEKSQNSETSEMLTECLSKINRNVDEIRKCRLMVKNMTPVNDLTEMMIQDFIRIREQFS
jgi:hypothetical protein